MGEVPVKEQDAVSDDQNSVQLTQSPTVNGSLSPWERSEAGGLGVRATRPSTEKTTGIVTRIANALGGLPLAGPAVMARAGNGVAPEPEGQLPRKQNSPPQPSSRQREEGAAAPSRLLYLDVFRGLTIAGMVLVNSPGSDKVYPVLDHAPWNGCTLADLVFPSFLVIMGVSMAVSLHKRLGQPKGPLLRDMAVRAAKLFGLGMLINLFWPIPGGHLRIMGVLQRIALCNWAAAAIYLNAGTAAQAAITVGLLAGYWALMFFVPVPGFGAGVLTPDANLASWLDRLLMPGRLLHGIYDNEGLLATIPALATAMLGVLAGRWLLSQRKEGEKLKVLLAAGAALAAVGLLWSLGFPLNKKMWTSSYALFAGGVALMGLAGTGWITSLKNARWFTLPMEVFGRNALLAYFASQTLYQIQVLLGARDWIVRTLFESWLSPANASLAYSVSYVAIFCALMGLLYRRKIFVKL